MQFLYGSLKYMPRPIHVLTTVAGLLITFRLGTMIDKMGEGEVALSTVQVDIGHSIDAAQNASPEAKPKEEMKKEEPKKEEEKKEVSVPFDPLTLDENQVKMLQSLAQRRKEIDEEAESLKSKKALLTLTEKKITEHMDELKKIKESIEKTT